MVTLPVHQAVVQIKEQPDGHQVTPQVEKFLMQLKNIPQIFVTKR